jgi:DNA topoisomerase I
LDKKRFTPTDVGRVVNKFLTEHFTQYVDYDFTAKLENELDEIAEGNRDWIPVMDKFWQGFNQQITTKADVERPGNELIDEQCPKCGVNYKNNSAVMALLLAVPAITPSRNVITNAA